MKKVFSILLSVAILLSMSITSFATDITTDGGSQQTVVTYGTSQSFTVTIPSNVVIDTEGAGEATVSASNVMIASGSTLKVTINSDDYVNKWELVDKNEPTNTLTYYIENPAEELIASGDVVLSVASGEAYNSTVSDVMYFWLDDTATKSGEYTDTLTFTVSIEDDGLYTMTYSIVGYYEFTIDDDGYIIANLNEEGLALYELYSTEPETFFVSYNGGDSISDFTEFGYIGDGEYMVYHTVGDIELTSSVIITANFETITFTVGDYEYMAKKDQTWSEWVNTDFSKIDDGISFEIRDSLVHVYTDLEYDIVNVVATDEIIDGYQYSLVYST